MSTYYNIYTYHSHNISIYVYLIHCKFDRHAESRVYKGHGPNQQQNFDKIKVDHTKNKLGCASLFLVEWSEVSEDFSISSRRGTEKLKDKRSRSDRIDSALFLFVVVSLERA